MPVVLPPPPVRMQGGGQRGTGDGGDGWRLRGQARPGKVSESWTSASRYRARFSEIWPPGVPKNLPPGAVPASTSGARETSLSRLSDAGSGVQGLVHPVLHPEHHPLPARKLFEPVEVAAGLVEGGATSVVRHVDASSSD